MKNIITDDMVQKAFEHMNSKADPIYGEYKEFQLGNPYINAGFAVAIKELFDIEICESMVPTLEEINNLRGKNEVYVIHEQDYDVFWVDAVLTKDKFEEFVEKFAEKNLEKYQDDKKVKSITPIRKDGQVLWEIEYTDEYLQKVYSGYLGIRGNTLDDLKKQRSHVSHVGFDYSIFKINEYTIYG